TITLSAGGNLVVNPASLNAQPLGLSGTGGTYDLTAGTAGPGNITLTQAFSVDGKGGFTGGIINASAANGSIFVQGPSGSLTANGGFGGTINF
ncbi:hypothetical protein ABTH88_19135, partial [Acinetobacter baumannii]